MSVLEDRDRGCLTRPAARLTASLPGSRPLSWEVEPPLSPIYHPSSSQMVGVPSRCPLACGLGSEGNGGSQWVN